MARTPATDAMLTIAPPPLSSIAGIWCFMPRNVPRTLVRMPTVELVGIDLRERRRHRPVGGVVERGVETAERVDGERHERAHRVVITDVDGRSDRTAARRLDLTGHVTQRSGVACAERHGVTGGGERLGGVGPDASARTGDERNLEAAVPWLVDIIDSSCHPPTSSLDIEPLDVKASC